MTYVDYAQRFIGKAYIWAGTGATGFDCSGLVVEVLQAFGLLPYGDWSAAGLADKLVKEWTTVNEPQEGDLVFWGSPTVTHVAIMVNSWQIIEAGGGDSSCTTIDNSKGLVRLRPLSWRAAAPVLILRCPHGKI